MTEMMTQMIQRAAQPHHQTLTSEMFDHSVEFLTNPLFYLIAIVIIIDTIMIGQLAKEYKELRKREKADIDILVSNVNALRDTVIELARQSSKFSQAERTLDHLEDELSEISGNPVADDAKEENGEDGKKWEQ